MTLSTSDNLYRIRPEIWDELLTCQKCIYRVEGLADEIGVDYRPVSIYAISKQFVVGMRHEVGRLYWKGE